MGNIQIDLAELRKMVKESVRSRIGTLKECNTEKMAETPMETIPESVPAVVGEETLNENAARELMLFINKSQAARQALKEGKSVVSVVNEASKSYVKEYGKPTDKAGSVFNKPTRQHVANLISKSKR